MNEALSGLFLFLLSCRIPCPETKKTGEQEKQTAKSGKVNHMLVCTSGKDGGKKKKTARAETANG